MRTRRTASDGDKGKDNNKKKNSNDNTNGKGLRYVLAELRSSYDCLNIHRKPCFGRVAFVLPFSAPCFQVRSQDKGREGESERTPQDPDTRLKYRSPSRHTEVCSCFGHSCAHCLVEVRKL